MNPIASRLATRPIIVLDGADPGILSSDGMGNFGITGDNQRAIVQAVLRTRSSRHCRRRRRGRGLPPMTA